MLKISDYYGYFEFDRDFYGDREKVIWFQILKFIKRTLLTRNLACNQECNWNIDK